MLKEFLNTFKTFVFEYITYEKRLCHSCGKKLKKGEGWEAYASYRLYCDDCFKKFIEKGGHENV